MEASKEKDPVFSVHSATKLCDSPLSCSQWGGGYAPANSKDQKAF